MKLLRNAGCRPWGSSRWRAAGVVLALIVAALPAACTHYSQVRAEFIVTSSPGDAQVFLVPARQTLPPILSIEALKDYRVGRSDPRHVMYVEQGNYWLVLEKNGRWSDPAQIEIIYGHVNDVHVEF